MAHPFNWRIWLAGLTGMGRGCCAARLAGLRSLLIDFPLKLPTSPTNFTPLSCLLHLSLFVFSRDYVASPLLRLASVTHLTLDVLPADLPPLPAIFPALTHLKIGTLFKEGDPAPDASFALARLARLLPTTLARFTTRTACTAEVCAALPGRLGALAVVVSDAAQLVAIRERWFSPAAGFGPVGLGVLIVRPWAGDSPDEGCLGQRPGAAKEAVDALRQVGCVVKFE